MAKTIGKKTKAKKQYSATEKKSFFAGLFTGLKKKKSTKNVPKNTDVFVRHNIHMRDDGDVYLWAYRYAKHMGKKFGLSDKEVLQNAHAHFEESKRNRDMYAFLKDQYSGQ